MTLSFDCFSKINWFANRLSVFLHLDDAGKRFKGRCKSILMTIEITLYRLFANFELSLLLSEHAQCAEAHLYHRKLALPLDRRLLYGQLVFGRLCQRHRMSRQLPTLLLPSQSSSPVVRKELWYSKNR